MSDIAVLDRTHPDAALACHALARVVAHWGDPHGFTFTVEAYEECAEVRISRKASSGFQVCDLPITRTALDPGLSDGALLTREIQRRRARFDADLHR